jgi:hypothetical protein
VLALNERYIINAEGQKVGVVLDVAVFESLVKELEALRAQQPLIPTEETVQALEEASARRNLKTHPSVAGLFAELAHEGD